MARLKRKERGFSFIFFREGRLANPENGLGSEMLRMKRGR